MANTTTGDANKLSRVSKGKTTRERERLIIISKEEWDKRFKEYALEFMCICLMADPSKAGLEERRELVEKMVDLLNRVESEDVTELKFKLNKETQCTINPA